MLHKIIKKVGPELHVFLNSAVLLFCVILLLGIVVLVFKHEKLKMAMYYFANQAAIASKQRYVGADTTEDAYMLSATLTAVPASKPLWLDKDNMQKLVDTLSKQTGRNIVVEDTTRLILAASVPTTIGKVYSYGGIGANFDLQTMQDGKPRRYIDRNNNNYFDEVVVQVKDSTGTTVGAVIMSTSHIFDDK